MGNALPPNKPEVMSPAGHWPQLHAGIEAGADAVYFGLTHFTARAKVGFTLGELPAVMRTLHSRGLKGYVTYNSLIFDRELQAAAEGFAAIVRAGADAVIVQDLALVKLARRIAPDLDLHASTQMSLTDAAGVRLAHNLGVRRIILARELSLDEVRAIRARTDCELELFVHGALCVSYSGQCFSSEAWGGRSANRGQCAQACRLPYELLVDGRLRPLGDARYLLSPGDLYALRQVPEIIRSGVSALKIEGRYKGPDYVALVTRAYRQAVDDACAGRPLSVTRVEELQLEQVYSRGLGAHFLTGTNHQAVVQGRGPRHRGVEMGRVAGVLSLAVQIEPTEAHSLAPLKPGDGVVFDAVGWRSPEEPEEGGRLFEVSANPGGLLELRFANGAVDFSRIRPGDLLWRTNDPGLARVVRPFTEAVAPLRRQPVRVHVIAREGQPLQAEWRLAGQPDETVTVVSEAPLGTAQKRALTADLLSDQFGRLGNTPYELAELQVEIEGAPFAAVSLLNQLRRQAVERLAALQSRPRLLAVHDPAAAVAAELDRIAPSMAGPEPPQLHLLVRSPAQLEAALAARPASITLDYLDLYGLGPSVAQIRTAGIGARVAGPRILKPGEERISQFLLRLGCPILVRSTGLLEMLREAGAPPLTGDFSLNAANAISADFLLSLGLERLTPTHDLNAAQVAELAGNLGPGRVEVVAYQHLPVFHTEHCVFCRCLSTGVSYRDCGRPCDTHRIALRDVEGRAHPVMADVGCRNTVFGAQAQEASLHLEDWLAAGIRHFRLEFVHESPAQLAQVAQAFQDALAGSIFAPELGRRLRQIAPQGVTEGSLFVPAEALALPVLR